MNLKFLKICFITTLLFRIKIYSGDEWKETVSFDSWMELGGKVTFNERDFLIFQNLSDFIYYLISYYLGHLLEPILDQKVKKDF